MIEREVSKKLKENKVCPHKLPFRNMEALVRAIEDLAIHDNSQQNQR
jgi:hypothetical protein